MNNSLELNTMIDENIELAQEETGYEFTPEEMEYHRQLIEKMTNFYMKKDSDKKNKRKIKAKNRAANKVARKARKLNRNK